MIPLDNAEAFVLGIDLVTVYCLYIAILTDSDGILSNISCSFIDEPKSAQRHG
jgi:hypothetical protein